MLYIVVYVFLHRCKKTCITRFRNPCLGLGVSGFTYESPTQIYGGLGIWYYDSFGFISHIITPAVLKDRWRAIHYSLYALTSREIFGLRLVLKSLSVEYRSPYLAMSIMLASCLHSYPT